MRAEGGSSAAPRRVRVRVRGRGRVRVRVRVIVGVGVRVRVRVGVRGRGRVRGSHPSPVQVRGLVVDVALQIAQRLAHRVGLLRLVTVRVRARVKGQG